MHVLPDILAPRLRVVFCGTAPGDRSAAVGAYYAHEGNRFWRLLHETGLTPVLLRPDQFPRVLEHGIGLTDVVKCASGSDDALDPADADPAALHAKILAFQPAILAFNSKCAAAFYYGCPTRALGYGRQEAVIGATAVHVLPSTSGAACGEMKRQVRRWFELAEEAKALT